MYWCQFHQHFTCAFFANIFAPKNFKPETQLCNFLPQNMGAKCPRKMLMKSTPAKVRRIIVDEVEFECKSICELKSLA